MKTLFITGTSGFLGAALSRRARDAGYTVVRGQRDGAGDVAFDLIRPDQYRAQIAACDVVIHCAWDKGPRAREVNLNAVRTLRQIAAEKDRQFIFISSMAAHAGAESVYGRTKFAAEALVREYPHSALVRPGTIAGAGGLFETMRRMLRTFRIVPVFFGDARAVQLIGIDDLNSAILRLVDQDLRGEFNLASADAVPMPTLYRTLSDRDHLTRTFVRLPGTPVLAALAVTEALGLRLPITRDNLLGLKNMRAFETRADWGKLWAGVTAPPALPDALECLRKVTADL